MHPDRAPARSPFDHGFSVRLIGPNRPGVLQTAGRQGQRRGAGTGRAALTALAAPVLPGISDAPEQLEAVVNACVQAGATSISALSLHLRAGVRQHFFDWLAAHRPELVSVYERHFQRAYVPAKDQEALSVLVRTFVARARGRSASPQRVRSLTPQRPKAAQAAAIPPPTEAGQLRLNL